MIDAFLLSAFWAVATTPPHEAREPLSLCVALQSTASVAAPLVRSELVAALRGRVAGEVAIEVCREEASPQTQWRVQVYDDGGSTWRVEVVGPDVDAAWTMSASDISPQQLVQRMALRIAEAVRPSLNTLLGRAGPPVAAVLPPAVAVPTPHALRYGIGATIGAVAGLPRWEGGYWGELAARLQHDPIGVQLYVGASGPHRASSSAGRLRGTTTEVGLRALLTRARWEVAVAAQSRLLILHWQDVGDTTTRRESFWLGGIGVGGTAWAWRGGGVRVGMTGRVTAWPRIQRFWVRGVPVYQSAQFEVAGGAVVDLVSQ